MFGFGGCGGGYLERHPHYYDERYDTGRNMDYELLRNEIRKLYATGDISSQAQYHDALDRLDRGIFTMDDLWALRNNRQKVERSVRREENLAGRLTPDIGREMENLERKKAEIGRAKEEIGRVIADINRSVTVLKERMEQDEQLAKEAVNTEDERARVYLRRRQETAEQVARLEARLKELTADMEQLGQMETQVDTRLLELKALGQRERLSQLEVAIKGLGEAF
ncbi:MAG: hypothetical protein ACYCVD_08905 [Desulfitobacteriaceae bacterium]